MATAAEVEKKVQVLEKALSDAEGAIRTLAQEKNNLGASLVKMNEELNKTKAEVSQLKATVQKLASKPSGGSVTRYE